MLLLSVNIVMCMIDLFNLSQRHLTGQIQNQQQHVWLSMRCSTVSTNPLPRSCVQALQKDDCDG